MTTVLHVFYCQSSSSRQFCITGINKVSVGQRKKGKNWGNYLVRMKGGREWGRRRRSVRQQGQQKHWAGQTGQQGEKERKRERAEGDDDFEPLVGGMRFARSIIFPFPTWNCFCVSCRYRASNRKTSRETWRNGKGNIKIRLCSDEGQLHWKDTTCLKGQSYLVSFKFKLLQQNNRRTKKQKS